MYVKQELSTADIQEIIFRGLKEFRDFCDANDIKYFIAYGTLLLYNHLFIKEVSR